ncbi:MAG: PTS IIA-like nitrogen-regulatory protein PtsN [Rhodospirillaceae bacterium]|nr:PTS IIA-like nitrogen-regulatory protein PtsN [Rhodospirillaceae bacterium]|tara:strand:+ start:957 stop:1421 length:465 start_codon:yes stop_codon:yes gene_type:complete
MELVDFITPESIVLNLKATSKKLVLEELAKHAAQLTGLHERVIFDVLLERERLGTTGVGRSVAIPHGKLPDLKKLCGMFARLNRPVNFDSVDDQPVDIIFLLLAPESAGADHLKALARVSRLLRDTSRCERLRTAKDGKGIYRTLTEIPRTNAA